MKKGSTSSDRKKRHDAFVQETVEFLKRKMGVTLTPDEAEDAIRNACDYIRLLARFDSENKKRG